MYDGSNGQLGIYVLVFILYLSFKIGSLFTLNLALPIIFFIYLNVKNLTFAGNSGSYFLGYFLSYIVLKIHNQTDFLTSDEIVLIMFYPVLDLVRLFFYRVINNKNPLSADRNHIHHILQEKKYNNKKIQFILLLIICFPIIVYELTNINIILIFLMKIFFYYIIVSKKFIFLK
jgi:UDP-GlcNAc:undecaprenyl-phosphate GlcNAc-1-phosphate transferase